MRKLQRKVTVSAPFENRRTPSRCNRKTDGPVLLLDSVAGEGHPGSTWTDDARQDHLEGVGAVCR